MLSRLARVQKNEEPMNTLPHAWIGTYHLVEQMEKKVSEAHLYNDLKYLSADLEL